MPVTARTGPLNGCEQMAFKVVRIRIAQGKDCQYRSTKTVASGLSYEEAHIIRERDYKDIPGVMFAVWEE